jgi:hypothetical protein
MNWNQFLQLLISLYVSYYALVISFDLLKNKTVIGSSNNTLELHFREENIPLPVTVTDVTGPGGAIKAGTALPASVDVLPSGGQLQSTGAVSFSGLFELAQADLIEYTKHIPY